MENFNSNQELNKIEFLADCKSENYSIHNLYFNKLASVRLRTAISAEAAQKLNYQIKISDGYFDAFQKILVVGKITNITDENRPSRWLKYISESKKKGTKIIIDYTDHVIEENTIRGDFYRKSIKFADVVVCSSLILKNNISKHYHGLIYLIEEPIEVPITSPIQKNNSIKNILWFGHGSNLSYLFDCLLNTFNKDIHARLIIMTNEYPFPKEYSKILSVEALENIEVNVVPWSTYDLVKAASICDFCILPTGHNESRKSGASPNRLLTSLALGLPVLSDSLNSYLKFNEYFEKLNTENLIKYTSTVSYDFEKVKESHQIIASNYSKDFIINLWQDLFDNLMVNKNFFEIKSDLIKLNLGCGDKILDGYINIDVVESRAGKKPDFICDLHNLSKFKSNSVDEILAVHVVEHFWKWEVVDILKEWTRVLKPGGKMILECPNLISAAEEFLKNSDIAAIGGPEGQRSMWVFYGDPSWKDPLMIHRWGYTPRSLATLMSTAGLTELKQEPAQFKLREPRDMRITGLKSK
jgi:SAM-dependent methyltransferase